MKTKIIQTDEGEIHAETGERVFYLKVTARRTPTNEVEGSGWFSPSDFGQFLFSRFTVGRTDGLDAYNKHAGQQIVDIVDVTPAELPKTKLPKLVLDRPDPETLEVRVGKKYVGSANHDEHGWSGMSAVEELAKSMAKALGLKVKRKGI